MDQEMVRKMLLAQMGVRIEPEMSRYLAEQLARPRQPVFIMGENARTGAPVYQQIDALSAQDALQ